MRATRPQIFPTGPGLHGQLIRPPSLKVGCIRKCDERCSSLLVSYEVDPRLRPPHTMCLETVDYKPTRWKLRCGLDRLKSTALQIRGQFTFWNHSVACVRCHWWKLGDIIPALRLANGYTHVAHCASSHRSGETLLAEDTCIHGGISGVLNL